MEQTSGFWAGAIAVAAAPVAIAAGIAKGSYDAASGAGSFDAGFHSAADPVIVRARKFGTDHQDTITKGVIGGAATAFGARVVGEGIKVIFRR
ncbi:MAG TPA: hypothetical protein VFJ07_17150 [Streptosporangiaceae bacterium]|nr:hypothetical protein [Streptosporangiaceae bacterium]